MKPVRWTPHALKNLADREIPRQEADQAFSRPEAVSPGRGSRKIYMRRYFDSRLQQQVLIRAVVEETPQELVVTTVYITSKIGKYM